MTILKAFMHALNALNVSVILFILLNRGLNEWKSIKAYIYEYIYDKLCDKTLTIFCKSSAAETL